MSGKTSSRGQIQYDFAVGVSILVLAVIVAFTFVPGLFGGVTEGRVQGDQVAADRVAASLAEGGLGDPSRPGTVDIECIRAFFDSTVDFCDFRGSSVSDNLFLDDRHVNVSIRSGSTLVCLDPSSKQLGKAGESPFSSGCSSSIPLTGDGSPGGGSTVSVTTRPVSIDGYQARVVVRVW